MSPPELGDVDELCRLVLTAQRLGCTVTLTGASDELRELLDLAGLAGLLVDPPADLDSNGTDLR